MTVQALSGTGALRLGARFLSYALSPTTPVYISDPTWGNHLKVFEHSALTNQVRYPYYDKAHNSLDYAGMMGAISKAPRGAIILLHACAHNPTGIDPTKEQWQEILKVIKEHGLVPFLDLAYQGFATGDIEADAYAVRLFFASGLQFVVAQSFAKNIGLYGERIGALHVVCPDADTAKKVFSNVQIDIRAMYSNPPTFGARIVGRILKTPALYAEWVAELKAVAERIKKMRQLLYDALVANKAPGTWDHIVKQIGMFSYTGLTKPQCEWLIKEYHIHLLKSGRISMAGVNTGNVARLATAITDAVTRFPAPA
jgi:aspartate aminotransferase